MRTSKLTQIAVPCFIEQLLAALVGIISAMIVGHLGKAELTAANMTNTVVNWLQGIYTGLSAGSIIVIGRMWGSNDLRGVQKAFVHSVILNTAIGILIMLILVVFQSWVIEIFFGGAEADVKEKMDSYFRLSMISMPATAVLNIICACLRGIGDNKTAMYNTVMVNIINLCLAYPLIYGIPSLGVPALGIMGAGLAILIARYLTMLLIIIYVIKVHKPVMPDTFRIKIDKGVFKRIINVGIPSAAEQFIFNGGFVILQSVLISFGTVFQAGYQIGGSLNQLMCVPSLAIGVAITALTSQALGRKNMQEALENVKAARFLHIVISGVMGILMFLMSTIIVRLYTSDEAVIKEGIFFIQVFVFESFAIGYIQTLNGVLRGAGDIKYILVCGMVALWVCRVGGTWLLSKFIDPHIALVIGLSSDFYLRAILCHIRVQQKKWLEIVV